MPVYNAVRFVDAAIASVQAQSHQDWELLVVDDGSQDGSLDILLRHVAADPRIHLLQTGGNHGAGVARNLGLEAARGRFLAFLDADDLWHPEKLTLHLRWLGVQPAGLSFTAYLREDMATGQIEGIGVPDSVDYTTLLATNVIGCSTVILDRHLLGEPRMPNLRLRQDFACWLEILRRHGPARGLPVALTTYRKRAGQASGNKVHAARATWAMYRHQLGLPPWQAGGSFARYALRGLLRHRAAGLARWLGWLQDPVLFGSPQAEAFGAVRAGPDRLTVAIATTAPRMAQLDFAALPAQAGVIYWVFVQGGAHGQIAPREDIRILATQGRGAARNRNAALQVVTTPYLLFADDDQSFDSAGHAALIARFDATPEADFLCARLLDETGQPRKRYCPDGVAAHWTNCGKVGTPELALRVTGFHRHQLRFDERFGAGMPDHLGDEYIFLCDAMRRGLRGMHVAIPQGGHPRDSSGTRSNAAIMSIRKRVLIRALGRWKGRPARWAFALTHRRDFPDMLSLLRFL